MAEQTNRKTIRDKLVAVITAGVSDFGGSVNPALGRVFENRMKPIWEAELPAVNVYGINESAEIFNVAPREYKRTLAVRIDVVVKADENTDDAIDALTRKIEKILFMNETLDGVVSDVVLGDTEMELDTDGRSLTGLARMTWLVTYFTFAPGDEALENLDDFERMHAKTVQTSATETTPTIEDEIELEQEE